MYDSSEKASATSASTPSVSSAPPGTSSRPNGMAMTIITIAWASMIVTSRSERPASIAKRLIGVTRIRSTTP